MGPKLFNGKQMTVKINSAVFGDHKVTEQCTSISPCGHQLYVYYGQNLEPQTTLPYLEAIF